MGRWSDLKGKEDKPAPMSKAEEHREWSNVLVSALKNTPKSAGRFLGDIWESVIHPVKTGKAVGSLVLDVAKKTSPYTLTHPEIQPNPVPTTKYLDSMVDFFKDRYGSVDKLKTTIAEDPVGVTADISSFFVAAGTPVRATKVGSVVAKTGSFIDPITITKNVVVGGVGKGIRKKWPEKLYLSAAKPSPSMPTKARNKIVRTALDNGIMPTINGLQKTRQEIAGLNAQIDTLVAEASKRGSFVHISQLFKGFDKLKMEKALSGKPMTNINAIEAIRKQHMAMAKKTNKYLLNPTELQNLKKNIYKDLESYYSSIKESPANAKAQQAIAMASKEALEQMVPEIKHLNQTEGAMIELRSVLEKSASRILNRDLMGIGIPLKGTLGTAIGDVPGALAGLSLGMLDTPKVKAKLALALEELRKRGIKVRPTATAIEMGLFQHGRWSKQQKDDQAFIDKGMIQ